jgi:hypothetical protein
LRYQVFVLRSIGRRDACELARRRSPDEIKLGQLNRRPGRVALDKLEGVIRLRLDIDADHIEARAVQAHRCAATTTEQIERQRPFQHRVIA